MRLAELEPAQARARMLAGPGLALRTGPVVFRVQTSIRDLASSILALYAQHPLAEPDSIIDFDVRVDQPAGLRRWIRPQVTFEMDGQRPFAPLAHDQGLPLLEWGLNWCVYSQCHQYLVVHAAVLEQGGRALLLPAPSGSGKSTLCAGLALSGWRLLSDELALIDSEGRVVPLPRPVSLKNRSIEVIQRRFASVRFGSRVEATVKGVVAHFPPPAASVALADRCALPGWIVLPRWQAGAKTALTPFPKARALMALVQNAFNYDLFGAAGFERLAQVVDGCTAFEFEYADLDEALAVFSELAAAGRP
jgi:HprK-related kinase A